MFELSLFTGAGGGILGTKLLGWTPIGYVEFNDYCQRVLAQRIKDGHIENAPIFGDIRAFISEGYAASYKGLVDVVTAGFPCQPFSVAGKGLGEDDPRNMWPATLECINLVRPRFAYLENVPGLLSSGYFGRILGDLVESGYDCRWRVLSAAEVGAPHKRDRLWIYCNANSYSKSISPINDETSKLSEDVAYPLSKSGGGGGFYGQIDRQGRQPSEGGRASIQSKNGPTCSSNFKSGRQVMAHPDSIRTKRDKSEDREGCGTITCNKELADTETIYAQGFTYRQGKGELRGKSWWSVEPGLGRVANGVAHRVDRLKAIGNGQVSKVVETAWELLNA